MYNGQKSGLNLCKECAMSKKIRVVVLVVLACAGAVWWSMSRPAVNPHELVLYGNVDLRQVALAFNRVERIAKVAVDEGQQVTAGQVLAELDTATLKLQLAQARAQFDAQQQVVRKLEAGSRPEELAQARASASAVQAEADLAGEQLARLQAVSAKTQGRGVSQQDLDAAGARSKATQAQLDAARKALQLVQNGPRKEDIAQAQAQLAVAKAAIALLEHQVGDAQLRAPVNATVRARLMEAGDMASPQRPVYTLAINDPKWVRAYVKETDLARIKPGMAAKISVDGLPGQTLAGKVGYISSVAEFTPKNVQTEDLRTALVYEVRVLADDKADRLRMGMPATVRIAQ
jgi:HlyD family secretion protein